MEPSDLLYEIQRSLRSWTREPELNKEGERIPCYSCGKYYAETYALLAFRGNALCPRCAWNMPCGEKVKHEETEKE